MGAAEFERGQPLLGSTLACYCSGIFWPVFHHGSLPVSHYFNLISIQKKVLRHLRIVGAIRILVGELNKNVLHEARLEEPRRAEDDLGITTLNIDFHERNLN